MSVHVVMSAVSNRALRQGDISVVSVHVCDARGCKHKTSLVGALSKRATKNRAYRKGQT